MYQNTEVDKVATGKSAKKVQMNEAIILMMNNWVSVASVNYNPFGCNLAESLLPLCHSFVVRKKVLQNLG